MGNKKPEHEWRGTIAVGSLELALRAYPAFGRAATPSLYQVHRDHCESPAQVAKSEASKKGSSKGSRGKKPTPDIDTRRARVQHQAGCMRCGKELRPDEIAW